MKDGIGVYRITHIKSKRFYVGSALNVKQRIERHLKALRKGTHENRYLQRAYNKYGEKAFSFRVYRYCTTQEVARDLEQSFLDNPKYFGTLLFNISKSATGGNLIAGLSKTDKDELSKRQSKNMKKRMSDPKNLENLREKSSGSNNPMYGKTHTEETRKVLSEKATANWTKAKRKKQSEKRKQYFEDNPEARVKLSDSASKRKGELNPFFGKEHTEETRATLSKKGKERYANGQYPTNSRKVKAHGKVYRSVAECARVLEIAPMTVIFRIKSKSEKFKSYSYKD